MKQQIKFLGIMAVIITIMAACGQTGWKTVDMGDYKIHYPNSFELKATNKLKIFYYKSSSDTTMHMIVVDNFTSDLDGFVKNIEKAHREIPGTSSVESRRIQGDNFDIHETIAIRKETNEAVAQYCRVEKGKGYMLMMKTKSSEIDKHKTVAEEMMRRLEIK